MHFQKLMSLLAWLSAFVALQATCAHATPPAPVPQTGQTKCYDTYGNQITCAGTGQDGDNLSGAAWPTPRFTDNGDQSITDNLTGLIWTKDPNPMQTSYPGFDGDLDQSGGSESVNDGAVTWQHALDFIAMLNAANYQGHNDWRLPNLNELKTLISRGEFYATSRLLADGGFAPLTSSLYWSSSAYTLQSQNFWGVDFVFGFATFEWSSRHLPVWPVRGTSTSVPKTGQQTCYSDQGTQIACAGTGQDGQIQAGVAWPAPRFSAVDAGTITDSLTGLIWTKNLPEGTKKWQEALDYVNGLNATGYLGYADWRLPNVAELQSLANFGQASSLDWLKTFGFEFPYFPNGAFWSSTTSITPAAGAQTRAYSVRAGDFTFATETAKSNYYQVWPVRGGTTVARDLAPPTVESFSLQQSYLGPTVSIGDVVATDNVGVTGWFVSESSATPSLTAPGWIQTLPLSYTFAAAGNKTLWVWVRDAAGNISAGASASTTVTFPVDGRCGSSSGAVLSAAPSTNLCSQGTPSSVTGTGPWNWTCFGSTAVNASCSASAGLPLTLSLIGSGGGSVNGDLSCLSGSACPAAAFLSGANLTLWASPDGVSTFTGWGGACSGTGTCNLVMNGAQTVTASFSAAPRAKVGQKDFSLLQGAYDDAATTTGAVIRLLQGSAGGGLTATRAISVFLHGGFDGVYSSAGAQTSLARPLLIRAGSVTMKGITVR